jgi:hypothetical protein
MFSISFLFVLSETLDENHSVLVFWFYYNNNAKLNDNPFKILTFYEESLKKVQLTKVSDGAASPDYSELRSSEAWSAENEG